MSHALRVGVADQIGYFRAYNTDGSAKTDLTSSTTGLALSVFRIGASAVSISSLSDKAADNTSHADGAIRQVQGNLYTVDLPDAAVASQCPSICVKGTYTGGVIEGVPHPIVGYDGTAVRVGASDGTGVTLAADQDVRNVGGTLPAVTLAASQPNYAPALSSQITNIRGECTVGTGSTTTSIVTSVCSPSGAVADQFKGRVVIFSNTTTTTSLRGAAALISASSNSATPTLTVSTLPASPASGDTFIIA